MRVVTAPNQYERAFGDITCFLAGGITNCPDWQSEVIEQLRHIEDEGVDLSGLVVLNPRRENFPINDPSAAEEQIKWEFDGLENCSIFSMYFCNSDSDQPICMYELGRNILNMQYEYSATWKDRIVISVESGYRREKDVLVQTRLATDEMIHVSRQVNPKFHAEMIAIAYKELDY